MGTLLWSTPYGVYGADGQVSQDDDRLAARQSNRVKDIVIEKTDLKRHSNRETDLKRHSNRLNKT